jgi:hypothetical protein
LIFNVLDFEDIDEEDIFDRIYNEKAKAKLKNEEDVKSTSNKKEEIKEEKKQISDSSQNNNQAYKPVGGLKGLLEGSYSTNNDARVNNLVFFKNYSRREDLKLHLLEEVKKIRKSNNFI